MCLKKMTFHYCFDGSIKKVNNLLVFPTHVGVFPDLPRLVLAGNYSESVGSRLSRSQPASGPALVRRKAGKRSDVTTGTLLFDSYAEAEAFGAWVNDVESGLAGGIRAFDWTHPITSRQFRMRIVPESDDILFTIRPYGQTLAWEVSLTLEVLP